MSICLRRWSFSALTLVSWLAFSACASPRHDVPQLKGSRLTLDLSSLQSAQQSIDGLTLNGLTVQVSLACADGTRVDTEQTVVDNAVTLAVPACGKATITLQVSAATPFSRTQIAKSTGGEDTTQPPTTPNRAVNVLKGESAVTLRPGEVTATIAAQPYGAIDLRIITPADEVADYAGATCALTGTHSTHNDRSFSRTLATDSVLSLDVATGHYRLTCVAQANSAFGAATFSGEVDVTPGALVDFSWHIAAKPRNISVQNSTVTWLNGSVLPADGSTAAQVKVHLVNLRGESMAATPLRLTPASAQNTTMTITPAANLTDSAGDALFTVTSTKVGLQGVSVFAQDIDGKEIELGNPLGLFFGSIAKPDLVQSTFEGDKSDIVGNGFDAVTIVVHMRDEHGQPLVGATATLALQSCLDIAQTGCPANISPALSQQDLDGDGDVIFQLTSHAAGFASVQASITNSGVTVTFSEPLYVTFSAALSLALSQFTAQEVFAANGQRNATINFEVLDTEFNYVTNLPVSVEIVDVATLSNSDELYSTPLYTTEGSYMASSSFGSRRPGIKRITAIATRGSEVLAFAPVYVEALPSAREVSSARDKVVASEDGRAIFFNSDIDLSGGQGGYTDVYVYDVQTEQIARINGDYGNCMVDDTDATGRFVLYHCQESPELLRRYDRQTSQTWRVTLNADQSLPYYAISLGAAHIAKDNPDVVVFESTAEDYLSSSATSQGYYSVFKWVAGPSESMATITPISLALSGARLSDNSGSSSVSTDGTRVAFHTVAAVSGSDTNAQYDVLLYQSGTTSIVSHPIANPAFTGNNASMWPALSPDGGYVAFESIATNIVTDFGQNVAYVYEVSSQSHGYLPYMLASGTSSLSTPAYHLSLSKLARFIGFTINDDSFSGLIPFTGMAPDTNGWPDYYVFDQARQMTLRVTSQPNDPGCYSPDCGGGLSSSGALITRLSSSASAQVIDNSLGTAAPSMTPTVASASGAGAPASVSVQNDISVSSDGRFVTFVSNAPQFGFAGKNHVFVKDRYTGKVELVSRHNGPNGSPLPEPSSQPVISPRGDVVAFVTRDTASSPTRVVVRDIKGQHTFTASIKVLNFDETTGEPIELAADKNDADCDQPDVSTDSSEGLVLTVAYRCASNESRLTGSALPASQIFVFEGDLALGGTSMLLSVNDLGFPAAGNAYQPSVSQYGKVAFAADMYNYFGGGVSPLSHVFVFAPGDGYPSIADNTTADLANSGSSHSARISYDGNVLTFISDGQLDGSATTGNNVYFRRLDGTAAHLMMVNDSGVALDHQKPDLSEDGHYITFLSNNYDTAPVSWPRLPARAAMPNGVQRVLLWDTWTQTVHPIDTSFDAAFVGGPVIHAQASASFARISESGRLVVAASMAQNITVPQLSSPGVQQALLLPNPLASSAVSGSVFVD